LRGTLGAPTRLTHTVPELPEVETISRGLAKAIVRKRIKSAEVFLAKIATHVYALGLHDRLADDHISAVARRAKYVVISLKSGRRLTVHLRMTGRLIVQPPARRSSNRTPTFSSRSPTAPGSVLPICGSSGGCGSSRLATPGMPTAGSSPSPRNLGAICGYAGQTPNSHQKLFARSKAHRRNWEYLCV